MSADLNVCVHKLHDWVHIREFLLAPKRVTWPPTLGWSKHWPGWWPSGRCTAHRKDHRLYWLTSRFCTVVELIHKQARAHGSASSSAPVTWPFVMEHISSISICVYSCSIKLGSFKETWSFFVNWRRCLIHRHPQLDRCGGRSTCITAQSSTGQLFIEWCDINIQFPMIVCSLSF